MEKRLPGKQMEEIFINEGKTEKNLPMTVTFSYDIDGRSKPETLPEKPAI